MAEKISRLRQEFDLSLERVDWTNKEEKRAFEAELRQKGLVAAVAKDGEIKEVMPLSEWTPDHVFTLKWNSAPTTLPDGTYYEDPLPPDWSLVPNSKGRLDLNDLELLHGVKYAIEGETAIMAVVTEDGGIKITHAGVYQDISNRDVSPAGKVWGSGPVAGMSPMWVEIDGWDDFNGAQLNAQIEGIKADDVAGDARRVESFPAEIEKLARNWREDLEKVLLEHEVYKDAKLKPGTRLIFTSGLLYWAQEYGTRYFQTEVTPIINATGVLSFPNGIEVESIMSAHTVEKPDYQPTEDQKRALKLWETNRLTQDVSVSAQNADEETQAGYVKDRVNQRDPSKLGRLVSEPSFVTASNPEKAEILELIPSIDELRTRYQELLANWNYGAGLDLLLVRNGDSTPQRAGKLPGVINTNDGILDDTIAKRSAQRSYDIATQLWDTTAPDLVISSGRTSSLATIDVALWSIGEPFPVSAIVRDWRLNERSFGVGVGHKASEYGEEVLHSFSNAIAGGENFSFVHLKALSFMIDLLETVNQFYQETGRSMKVVVSTHEGPMQILQAMLKDLQSPEEIFQPIESTHTERFMLTEPMSFPTYVTDEELNEGIQTSQLNELEKLCAQALAADSDSCAVALFINEQEKE
ncbi:MAG: hypothetical protein COU63_02355 [Candidatus Pacebacteria bacterium CG10_big_fil_rev_8_21_14_0_10_36_11]|nr:hypothetical protein [Candidatus Pacearchaeota archaeon]OIP73584.1 MAG: hypothetical protein AUK08_03360 [Candidatus Pacebacteria bacterium CG2_30_36_39]PIR64835.1 MAG: hypothetical protein COU63_02355 [Candidatus Pacebacteria bacterium CG10_big_fil_rev_8_21_14_0_10_36_11]